MGYTVNIYCCFVREAGLTQKKLVSTKFRGTMKEYSVKYSKWVYLIVWKIFSNEGFYFYFFSKPVHREIMYSSDLSCCFKLNHFSQNVYQIYVYSIKAIKH